MKLDYIKSVVGALNSDQVDCPYCGETETITTDGYPDAFTYHGDCGPVTVQCYQCGRDYHVQELVNRAFTPEPIEEEP